MFALQNPLALAMGSISRAMGRFTFIEKNNGELEAKDFKFSHKLFENYPEEVIIDTIKHEYIHYLMILIYKKNMKHNSVFKAHCRLLGVDDETYFNATSIKPTKRYVVDCINCGRTSISRDRYSSLLKGIVAGEYLCSKCKCNHLRVYDYKLNEYIKK